MLRGGITTVQFKLWCSVFLLVMATLKCRFDATRSRRPFPWCASILISRFGSELFARDPVGQTPGASGQP